MYKDRRAKRRAFIELVRKSAFELPVARYYDLEISIAYNHRQIKRKLENRFKVLLDAITYAGMWKDDRQVASVSIRRLDRFGPLTIVKFIPRDCKYDVSN